MTVASGAAGGVVWFSHRWYWERVGQLTAEGGHLCQLGLIAENETSEGPDLTHSLSKQTQVRLILQDALQKCDKQYSTVDGVGADYTYHAATTTSLDLSTHVPHPRTVHPRTGSRPSSNSPRLHRTSTSQSMCQNCLTWSQGSLPWEPTVVEPSGLGTVVPSSRESNRHFTRVFLRALSPPA